MFKFHKTVQRFRAKKLKYWNSTLEQERDGEELQLWIIRWFAVISHRVNPLQKNFPPLLRIFIYRCCFFLVQMKLKKLIYRIRKNFI